MAGLDRFKNVYRIASARHPDWDYSSAGMYFITVCTKNMACYFGQVANGEMQLNEAGKIAVQCWTAIPEHFSGVSIDQFVVMPNHVHGVVFIERDEYFDGNITAARRDVAMLRLYNKQRTQFAAISPLPGSLAAIIRSYKSVCTKIIHQHHPTLHFAWQPRYYDRIIRNAVELQNIRDYIYYNPIRWQEDHGEVENLNI